MNEVEFKTTFESLPTDYTPKLITFSLNGVNMFGVIRMFGGLNAEGAPVTFKLDFRSVEQVSGVDESEFSLAPNPLSYYGKTTHYIHINEADVDGFDIDSEVEAYLLKNAMELFDVISLV